MMLSAIRFVDKEEADRALREEKKERKKQKKKEKKAWPWLTTVPKGSELVTI